MKLSEIVKTLEGSSQEARDAVAGLIVRLGSARRASTYRCYGRAGADAVHAFLEASGVAHDMSPSSFDQNSVQFSFKDEASYARLSRAVSANPVHLMAHAVANGRDVSVPSDADVSSGDSGSAGEAAPATAQASVPFGRRVCDRTMEIYRAVAEVDVSGHPDAAKAVEYAKVMVRSAAPVAVVPPAVAEVALRYSSLTPYSDLAEVPKDLVFDVLPDDVADVAVRLVRPVEMIPVVASLKAPLAVQMDRSEWDGPEPLSGYLYRVADTLNRVADASAADDSERDLFVRLDAPLRAARAHEGSVDPLGTLRMSLTPRRVFQYVIDLYSAMYGVKVGMFGSSRLAVEDKLCSSRSSCDYENCRWEDIGDGPLPWDFRAMALCAVVFSDSELDSAYTDANYFVPGHSAPEPVCSDEETAGADKPAEDGARGLLRNELAAEWHAMFTTSDAGENAYVSEFSYTTNDGIAERARRLGRFRTDVIHTPASGAVSENPALRPADDDEAEFSPTSAFIAGVTACMRSTFGDSYSEHRWPAGSAPEHDPGYAVSAVYTGMSTDLSPDMADDSHEFPSIDATVWSRPAAFTSFISRLCSDRSIQHSFSQRSSGTSRRHVVIVETAFSAGRLSNMEPSELDALRVKLARTFVATAVNRRVERPSFAAEMDLEASAEYMGHLEAYVRRPLAEFASRPYGNGSDGHVYPSGVSVLFARDTYDRTYVVFGIDGSDANVARVNFRAMRGLPLLTAARQASETAAGVGPGVFRYSKSSDMDSVLRSYVAMTARNNAVPDDSRSLGGLIGQFVATPYADAVDYDDSDVGDDYVGVPDRDWYVDLGLLDTESAHR